MAGGREQRQHPTNIDQDEGGYTRGALLVVITIIATVSFKVGVNPPGGFWRSDKAGPGGHVAGDAVMMGKNPLRFRFFTCFSWMCFSTSVVLIVYLLNGASLKSRFFKGAFVFCIATLAFMFQIAYLPTAFTSWVL